VRQGAERQDCFGTGRFMEERTCSRLLRWCGAGWLGLVGFGWFGWAGSADGREAGGSLASKLLHRRNVLAWGFEGYFFFVMSRDESKGHAALRRGSVSVPGASYFLTFCTDRRRSGLSTHLVGTTLWDEMQFMERDLVWRMRAMTIMPDHVHRLIELGEALSRSRSVARLKAKTSTALNGVGLRWEKGFFDHRVRPEDQLGPIVRYIANNPIRVGLISGGVLRWPWFQMGEPERMAFGGEIETEADDLPDWLKTNEREE
jgi:putative transposase